VARKRVELRREEILDAAVRQVQRNGLAATRVADVAAELGVSPALVFYHFDTKERLIAEAFQHAAQHDLDRLAVAAGKGETALHRLRAVLRLYAPTGAAAGWLLWIDGWAMALRDRRLRTTLQRLETRWHGAVAELIAEGSAAGEFTCGDPEGAAARITAFIDGLAVQSVVRKNGIAPSTVHEWTREFTARELGLAPDALE
jgi:AcrR family transcriptional regulator